jgi:hypothetical protein
VTVTCALELAGDAGPPPEIAGVTIDAGVDARARRDSPAGPNGVIRSR